MNLKNLLKEHKSTSAHIEIIKDNIEILENELNKIEKRDYKKGYSFLNDKEFYPKDLLVEIKKQKQTLGRAEYKFRQVKNLLAILTIEELFIIESFYIKEMQWSEVLSNYNIKFKKDLTLSALRKKKESIFKRMYSLLEDCYTVEIF